MDQWKRRANANWNLLVIARGEKSRINPASINQANNILLEILIRFRAITAS
jgi:hypothetical protein